MRVIPYAYYITWFLFLYFYFIFCIYDEVLPKLKKVIGFLFDCDQSHGWQMEKYITY
jgi:hypothetical protein